MFRSMALVNIFNGKWENAIAPRRAQCSILNADIQCTHTYHTRAFIEQIKSHRQTQNTNKHAHIHKSHGMAWPGITTDRITSHHIYTMRHIMDIHHI